MEEYTGRNYHAVTRYGSRTSEARFQLYITSLLDLTENGQNITKSHDQ